MSGLITRRLEPSLGICVALLVVGLSCRWAPYSATWRSSSPSAKLSAHRCVAAIVLPGVFIRAG
jgi:hypothetical protein